MIVTAPDPVLDAVAEEVTVDAETLALADKLVTHVRHEENGAIGLAAPQIGVSKRVAAVRLGHTSFALINPVVKWRSPLRTKAVEGCLSLPGRRYEVERAHVVTVEYLTETGKKLLRKFDGLDARVVQHEIDHLDGVLISTLGPLTLG